MERDEARALFLAIRGQSGDHLLKRFEDIEDAVEEKRPGFLDLSLAERGAVIGALYVEAWANEGTGASDG